MDVYCALQGKNRTQTMPLWREFSDLNARIRTLTVLRGHPYTARPMHPNRCTPFMELAMFRVTALPVTLPTLLSAAIALPLATLPLANKAQADEVATMTLVLTASGTDSTQSDGEWSKASFRYQAKFSIPLQTDGVPSSVNMYDPEYAQKAMADAQRAMEKVQNAMQGKFSDEEEVEPEERYLMYIGQMDCPASVEIHVQEKVEGAYADVGGMQPYTQTFNAHSNGTKDELNMLCVGNSSTLDIKDKVLYRSNIGFPGVIGHYVSSEANRGNIQDDRNAQHNALPKILSEYLFNTLRVAPVQGAKKITLKPTEPVVTRVGTYGGYDGTLNVDISWNFVPAQ